MKRWFARSLDLLILSTAGFRSASAFVAPRFHVFTHKTRSTMSTAAASKKDLPENAPEHVLIAGAGIIGLSTAFYLHKEYGIRSTLIDVTGEVAPAASGKAGGFLALDWNDGSPTGPLTHRSFALHQALADELGAESIQYRRLTCAAIAVDPYRSKPAGKKLQTVEWADTTGGAVLGMRPLGDESTIAQVHPRMLCERMWQEIKENGGAKLQKGKVVDTARGKDGRLLGAQLEDQTIVEGDALLLACGPWTAPATSIMSGIKYHSAVIPTDQILSQCVFFSGCGDPEVYVRPDQTAYCTGYPDPPIRVTESPGQEQVLSEKIKTIVEAVRDATGKTTNGGELSQEPVLKQACYLPSTDDGIPLMGSIRDEPGVFVATGHTCWGILLGPASGEAMAGVIATGSSPMVDLRMFSPSRYGERLQPFDKVSA